MCIYVYGNPGMTTSSRIILNPFNPFIAAKSYTTSEFDTRLILFIKNINVVRDVEGCAVWIAVIYIRKAVE